MRAAPSTDCPIYRTLDLLSRKWVLHILRHLSARQRMRFSEIKDAIPGISSRLLSERLADLTEAGVLDRTMTRKRPVTVEYAITKKGSELKQSFDDLCAWGKKWGDTCACD